MEIIRVSFFGHRVLSNNLIVEKRLEVIVREMIETNDYTEFLVGRNGEFDLLASAVIHDTKQELNYANSSLVLVLPYMTAEYRNYQQKFNNYYDEIEICDKSAKSHYKAAIPIRNKSMVDRSNIVVCCLEHNSGGAFEAVQYAKRMNKWIVNIAEV